MPSAALDLFCGIGGLTHGLELSGIPVLAGFDIDPSCRYAYEKNNHATFIESDVSKINADFIINYYPKDVTRILVGCAPCQPFSKYTQRYRKEGHIGNKWRLLDSFARLVREVRPDIVSMENVPELASQTVFSDFVQTLKNERYHVSFQIVYCPDYGVPQVRKRLVLLASLNKRIELIPPLVSSDHYKTVRETIGTLPAIKAGESDINDPLHTASRLTEVNLRRIRSSVPGGTGRDWDVELQLSCHRKTSGQTYPAVYGRMEWDQPAPTITTQFYGYGNGRFGHPEQDRALSLREGAMLQSFPHDYEMIEPGARLNRREIGIHIGNAVPVNLGLAIGLSIQQHIARGEGNA